MTYRRFIDKGYYYWCLLLLGYLLLVSIIGVCPAEIPAIQGRLEYLQNKYLLGPGDILTYEVLHEPDYTQDQILINPSGTASFKGVGELNVANLSIQEVSQLIETQLKKTIRDPQVTITLKSTRPGIVYLSGAVQHPGMFQFITNSSDRAQLLETHDNLIRTDLRLTNVLANAGGVKMNADLSNITVTHVNTGEKVTVNLWKVLKEGNSQEDVWVNYGDHVHVPENSLISFNDADYQILLSSSIAPKTIPIRVIGEVKNPGVYNLDSTSPYLKSAISMAGGFAPQANRSKAIIQRFTDEKRSINIQENLHKEDCLLRPNDLIFISENKVYLAGRFSQQFLNMLMPFQSPAMTGAAITQIWGLGGWARPRP